MTQLKELFQEKLSRHRRAMKEGAPGSVVLPRSMRRRNKCAQKVPFSYAIELRNPKYEYEVLSDVKVYNGVSKESRARIEANIAVLRNISPCNALTPISPSVLSVQGELSNVSLHEEKETLLFRIPPRTFPDIVKVGSNYSEMYVFPCIRTSHSLPGMLRSIMALNNQSILIGCACQPPLDVAAVRAIMMEIADDTVAADTIKGYIKSMGVDKSLHRDVKKVLKNLKMLLEFRLTKRSLIAEIYGMLESVVAADDLNACNRFVERISAIITLFSKYALQCTCWKKSQYKPNFSAAARKQKVKKNTKRKKRGTGMYLGSQISFDIFNHDNDRVSKIKLFRNGSFQVPGVKQPDISDLIGPIQTLREYWNYCSLPAEQQELAIGTPAPGRAPSHEVSYILSNMRNYKSNLANKSLLILINKLESVIYYEKEMLGGFCMVGSGIESPAAMRKLKLMQDICAAFPAAMRHEMFKHVNFSYFAIAEVDNNSERRPGLSIKFNRPIPSKQSKKLTIKVLSSGKVNFDGGNSELEIVEMYYWFQYILHKYWDVVIYDPMARRGACTSDSEYESIYDSDN